MQFPLRLAIPFKSYKEFFMTIRRVLISLALLTGMSALAPISAMADEVHHPVHHHHHPVCHYEHHHKVCH